MCSSDLEVEVETRNRNMTGLTLKIASESESCTIGVVSPDFRIVCTPETSERMLRMDDDLLT